MSETVQEPEASPAEPESPGEATTGVPHRPGFLARPAVAHVAVFGAYWALWTLISWPLALTPFTGRLATRQFDLYPSIWLVDTAPSAFPNMVSEGTAWPLHELLSRADSYVLLLLGWLNLGILSGATICALVAWIGVPLSAWVAERCAGDGFGVARPWSLIAGLCYGFSGVAATAMLEGHVYHLFNPWLPMMWWAWQRAQTSDGVRSGLYIGAAFVGALYTTAYFGVFAIALLVMLSLEAPKVAQRVAPSVAAVAVPAGLYYVWLFRMSSRFQDTDATSSAYFLRMGTVSASQLIGWDPLSDISSHSLTGALPLMALPLALGAIAAVRRIRLLPFVLAALCICVALGRTWRWDPSDAGFDLPVDTLLFGQLAYFRFPVRALWLANLVIGVQAARTLGALGPRSVWLGRGALLLATVDAIVGPGLPWRLASPVAGVPSAYFATPEGKAVLDLWAQPADRSSGEMEMWARNLTCYYAGQHGRPTPEVCIGTGIRSPREVLDAWVTQRALAGDKAVETATTLADLGYGGVAVHEDLYRPVDAEALKVGLEAALGPAIAESSDGGEHVVIYGVPASTGTPDPRTVWRQRVIGG